MDRPRREDVGAAAGAGERDPGWLIQRGVEPGSEAKLTIDPRLSATVENGEQLVDLVVGDSHPTIIADDRGVVELASDPFAPVLRCRIEAGDLAATLVVVVRTGEHHTDQIVAVLGHEGSPCPIPVGAQPVLPLRHHFRLGGWWRLWREDVSVASDRRASVQRCERGGLVTPGQPQERASGLSLSHFVRSVGVTC